MIDWTAAGLTPAAISTAVTSNMTDFMPVILVVSAVTLGFGVWRKLKGALTIR